MIAVQLVFLSSALFVLQLFFGGYVPRTLQVYVCIAYIYIITHYNVSESPCPYHSSSRLALAWG